MRHFSSSRERVVSRRAWMDEMLLLHESTVGASTILCSIHAQSQLQWLSGNIQITSLEQTLTKLKAACSHFWLCCFFFVIVLAPIQLCSWLLHYVPVCHQIIVDFACLSYSLKVDRNPNQYLAVQWKRLTGLWLAKHRTGKKHTIHTHVVYFWEIRISYLVGDFVTVIRFKWMSIYVNSYLYDVTSTVSSWMWFFW